MGKLRCDVTWPQLEETLGEMSEADQAEIRRMMEVFTGVKDEHKRKVGGVEGVGARTALEILVQTRRWLWRRWQNM